MSKSEPLGFSVRVFIPSGNPEQATRTVLEQAEVLYEGWAF